MRRAGIVGVGFWAPETVRRNDAWPEEFARRFREERAARRREDLTEVERRVRERKYDELFVKHALPFENDPFKGTVERRIADPRAPIAEGDAAAGRRALSYAGLDPADVDVVMASAIVHDKLLPNNASAIQDLVGCRRAAPLGVEAYCASAVAQIDLAAALIESERARYVLCVSSHHLSHVNDLRSPTSPMFGDASGAFLVGPVPDDRGLIAVKRDGDGSFRDAISFTQWEPTRAPWWEPSSQPWIVGTDDLARGRILTRDLLRFPIDMLRDLLEDARLPANDLGVLATIQPLCWFQAAVAEGLGVPQERVPSTHPSYAHVGGGAIAANLLVARERGILRDGTTVALYGQGAGFTRYAALLRWHAEPA
jgi:3-oxoacyl-[acyl-carrier-protein] synthase III